MNKPKMVPLISFKAFGYMGWFIFRMANSWPKITQNIDNVLRPSNNDRGLLSLVVNISKFFLTSKQFIN